MRNDVHCNCVFLTCSLSCSDICTSLSSSVTLPSPKKKSPAFGRAAFEGALTRSSVFGFVIFAVDVDNDRRILYENHLSAVGKGSPSVYSSFVQFTLSMGNDVSQQPSPFSSIEGAVLPLTRNTTVKTDPGELCIAKSSGTSERAGLGSFCACGSFRACHFVVALSACQATVTVVT